MDWFGNKKRAEKQKVLEKRLAELDARAVCANALAYCLLGAATIEQREVILSDLQKFVATKGGNPSPYDIPAEYHQAYRDELSRALQIYLKFVE
jgi:hypothetical protein